LAFGSRTKQRRLKVLIYRGSGSHCAVCPARCVQQGSILGPDLAIRMLTSYGLLRLWQLRTRRIQHTSVSGLLNPLALTTSKLEVGRDVVVAVIARYEELSPPCRMLSTANVHARSSGACRSDQVLAKSSTVTADTSHGPKKPARWKCNSAICKGCVRFFRPRFRSANTLSTPISTSGSTATRDLMRLRGSTRRWPVRTRRWAMAGRSSSFESHRLAEAPWELSLHARIEEGLRNGDIWLAFQSQLDLRQKRVVGAEALIRWNHPTRGPIAPMPSSCKPSGPGGSTV